MKKEKQPVAYNRFNPIKALAFSDKMWDIVNGHMPTPVIWHIYPSNACQNNCSFCIMKKEKENNVLINKELLYRAVEDCVEHRIRTIHFSGGGEPLLHPNIVDIMKYAKERKIKLALSTNGICLTQEILDLVDFPRVSLDADNAKNYFNITGNDAFDQITKNIATLQNKKKLGLGFLIKEDNRSQIYYFLKLAVDLGVGWVHIRPAYIPDKDKIIREQMPLVQMTMQGFIPKFPTLDIYYTKQKFDGTWTPRLYDKCRATPLIACMKADGKFCVCQDRTDLCFGDYNIQSFKEIWYSQEHWKVIDSINMDQCPRCVETKKNEYIEQIFVQDNCLMDIQ